MIDAYELTGLVGVLLSIYCYARVQWQRDYAKRLGYSLLNLLGSLLCSVSFLKHWNLPSFVSITVWEIISIYGIYRCMKYMRRANAKPR